MTTILYSTVEEIKELHRFLIERYGGTHGLRDEGLLASALYRPQSGYYDNIFEMAACLLQSLIQNHPFINGNKRAAFAAMDVFLRMNHMELHVSTSSAEKFIKKNVIEAKMNIKEISHWIQKHSKY